MTRLIVYALVGAIAGALVFFLAAEGLAEGAVAGALLGASLGVLVAMRRGAGQSTASFEYEAAGIHDDNLITTARRNLVREAYRDSFGEQFLEDKIENLDRRDQAGQRARRERH